MGTYDAGVGNKGAEGKVHANKQGKPMQYGAWTGIAVGVLVGLLTPMTVVGGAAAGGAVGALAGHLSRGMSRGAMEELGETLDQGEAALVAMGRPGLANQSEKATSRAQKTEQQHV